MPAQEIKTREEKNHSFGAALKGFFSREPKQEYTPAKMFPTTLVSEDNLVGRVMNRGDTKIIELTGDKEAILNAISKEIPDKKIRLGERPTPQGWPIIIEDSTGPHILAWIKKVGTGINPQLKPHITRLYSLNERAPPTEDTYYVMCRL